MICWAPQFDSQKQQQKSLSEDSKEFGGRRYLKATRRKAGFTMLFVDGWFSVNVDPLIWNMEMFRGLGIGWSERTTVWPVRERGVPAAGRLIARSVKMLGRARCGRSVAVTAIDGGADGALAGGSMDHPVPRVLVAFC